MCGSEGVLFKAKIEGAEMIVCSKCSKFGEIIGQIRIGEKMVKKSDAKIIGVEKEPEFLELVVSDFAEKMKRKREQLGLDQENFAKKINQKKSLVHKMETGEFIPDVESIKRLEKILGLRLVEQYAEEQKDNFSKKSPKEGMTIGDLITIKKRKTQ